MSHPKTAEELLLGRGVKLTPQRLVIAQYLMETLEHPTAEDVLREVKDRLPVPLSRATVYNTLNALVQAGVIREVFTEPGRTRYDANVNKHHHFVDVKTGAIMDIPWDAVPQLPSKLQSKFKVHGYEITFYGELEKS